MCVCVCVREVEHVSPWVINTNTSYNIEVIGVLDNTKARLDNTD